MTPFRSPVEPQRTRAVVTVLEVLALVDRGGGRALRSAVVKVGANVLLELRHVDIGARPDARQAPGLLVAVSEIPALVAALRLAPGRVAALAERTTTARATAGGGRA